MYWNYLFLHHHIDEYSININMRCIEMFLMLQLLLLCIGLTLTWDVLKYFYVCLPNLWSKWLTLTWDVLKSAPDIAGLPATWININMRCIEIGERCCYIWRHRRININMRCIEMSYLNTYSQTYHQININMRCIEI